MQHISALKYLSTKLLEKNNVFFIEVKILL